jgi:hypothetical protein
MPITYLPTTYNLTTYLPTHPPTYILFTYLPIHPPTYLHITYLPNYLSTYLPTYILTTYLPIPRLDILLAYLPIHPPTHPPTHLPCPTTYLLNWLTFYNQPKFMYLQPTYLILFSMLPTFLSTN